MFPTDDTQFPKRRKFDIANVESPMWHFYARFALPRELLKRTVPTSVQQTFILTSQARRCLEAEAFYLGPIQDRETFPFSHDCVVKDRAPSQAHEDSFRATVVAEEVDPRGDINLLSVLTSSNGRPMSLPPPLNLVRISVEAVGQPGGLGFNRCPAGKAADAKGLQGSIPDIDTRADSDVSLACHNGSCEPCANQETQCVLATSPHCTGVPINSCVQKRLLPAKDEKPVTPLQFLACSAAVVLALDPALEEGSDTWSVLEETVTAHDEAVAQSHCAQSVGTRSLAWPGPVHRNSKADNGYEVSTLPALRKKNENPDESRALGGNRKRSWNLGQQQALLPPLNSVPRRVPLEMNLALLGDQWKHSNVSVCYDMQNFTSKVTSKWFSGL